MPTTISVLLFLISVLPLAIPTIEAEWNRTYFGTTFKNRSISIYRYTTPEVGSISRVHISSNGSSEKYPLLAVFREQKALISIEIPFAIDAHTYNTAARTLCPSEELLITVELSSYNSVNYSLTAEIIPHEDFYLTTKEQRTISVTPPEPVYLQYDFPDNVSTVIVRANSDSSNCMTIAVQQVSCAVFDIESKMVTSGLRQTMTTSASIVVERSQMSSFYVVFIAHPDDSSCSNMIDVIAPGKTSAENRTKHINITVEHFNNRYVVPISVGAAPFLVIYIAAIVYIYWERKDVEQMAYDLFRVRSNTDIGIEEAPSTSGAVPHQNSHETREFGDDDSIQSYDYLPDAMDRFIVRTKLHLMVSDLSMKTWAQRERKYKKYSVSLATISCFYGLPVVQLVLNWVQTVRLSGDLDLCWYNFRCARPLFGMFAFNNILSNMGYISLGFLLVVLTLERSFRYQSLVKRYPIIEAEFGLPQHNGLLYAIGIAVIMEGVLSAAYHVCPSRANYQFDTSFMYVIGMLGMLKIYQLRHPDINANAHVSFGVMALFIFMAMIGTYFNSQLFWIGFSVVYAFTMLAVSLEVYFKGLWRFSFGEFINNLRYTFYSSKRCSCLKPSHTGRFIFVVLANGINVAFMCYGFISRPNDFASYLLLPFIANLFLYLIYYIVMKFAHGERLRIRSGIFLLITFMLWPSSGYFFTHHVSDWSQTAAFSRSLNQNCALMDFFDHHDIWHFLSSIAIFISFILINYIDDDLQFVQRHKIPVF